MRMWCCLPQSLASCFRNFAVGAPHSWGSGTNKERVVGTKKDVALVEDNSIILLPESLESSEW